MACSSSVTDGYGGTGGIEGGSETEVTDGLELNGEVTRGGTAAEVGGEAGGADGLEGLGEVEGGDEAGETGGLE
ncbi:MAG: hypothetical protein LBT14_09975, partial [Treponema sp.]|nr:hypothetical protein [Treponema sp.]